MSRARLLISESWLSIRQNLSTTVAATTTVLIAIGLLGLFLALGTWVLSYSNHLQQQLVVKVNFCNPAGMKICTRDTTPAEEQAVHRALSRIDHVSHITFIPKAKALTIAKKENPDLFPPGVPLLANPFPDQYLVTLTSPSYTPIVGKAICKAHYPGVAPCPKPSDSRNYGNTGGAVWGSAFTQDVLSLGQTIWIVFLVAVILLVVASTLLIANTIRLSIFSRRREIEVMKLVGATNWFIRGPFMLEGLLCGLFGSLLAVVLLVLGKTFVPAAIEGYFKAPGVSAMPFTLNALCLVVAGLLLGAAGSGLTIRRFLQV
jgi:cell division transport system permease protein